MSDARRVVHRVRNLWLALTSSLWFIPAAIVGVALVLAVVLVEMSAVVDREALTRFPRLFGAGAAGSRDMLAAIAGSVITVAGVTFSITIATLALASAQYTPRVLRTFMADRASQIVLGTFVGVYAYCLVVLRTIRGGDEGTFIPWIAVFAGFLLALLSVGVLIFFIHHIATGLQASTILERVRLGTERSITRLFPDEMGSSVDEEAERVLSAQAGNLEWRMVPATTTGYVQTVDADGLLSFAREHALVVRMERAVGDFVTAGTPLVSIARSGNDAGIAPELTRSANSLFTINAYRTVEQDVAFGILQISDIALKAVSPGINDTTTAVNCVDHLGALVSMLAGRRMAPRERGESQQLRVIAAAPDFATLVSLAFDDIRRSSEGNVTVLGRLLDAIETASRFTGNRSRLRILARQVDLVTEVVERSVRAPSDKELLYARARDVRKTVG